MAYKEKPTPSQAAWLRFVDRVEQGKEIDYSGQYVAKSTRVAVGATLSRVKRDARTADFRRFFKLTSAGEVVGVNPKDTGLTNIQECTSCDGGFGVVQSTFTSSVGRGGPGPIRDLKVMYNNPSPSSSNLFGAGYIMLNSDLNKGCGGAYIYFCFTRDAAAVLLGPEAGQNIPYSGRNNVVYAFQSRTDGGRFGAPYPVPNFFDIWTPSNSYVNPNLNGGAGGEYIYSYQSKDPASSTRVNFSEVGVLSGNSSTVMPPAGWVKAPYDLNEGAGGDYIYFCYR